MNKITESKDWVNRKSSFDRPRPRMNPFKVHRYFGSYFYQRMHSPRCLALQCSIVIWLAASSSQPTRAFPRDKAPLGYAQASLENAVTTVKLVGAEPSLDSAALELLQDSQAEDNALAKSGVHRYSHHARCDRSQAFRSISETDRCRMSMTSLDLRLLPLRMLSACCADKILTDVCDGRSNRFGFASHFTQSSARMADRSLNRQHQFPRFAPCSLGRSRFCQTQKSAGADQCYPADVCQHISIFASAHSFEV